MPRPRGRGTVRKRELRWRPYVARLASVFERIKLFLRRNWVVVKGCLIFGGCVLAFMLIYSRLVDSEALAGFLSFTAGATGFVLNIFGASVEVDGTLISSPAFSMGIVTGCTGIVAMLIFASAVLAYPCRAKQKAIGIALGVAALFVLNLVRTVSLFFIGSHFSSGFFDTAHFLIWQPVMIGAAIVLWLLWVEKFVRVPSH